MESLKNTDKVEHLSVAELAAENARLKQRLVKLESDRLSLKVAQEAHREAEDRLRTLYDANPIPTFVWTIRGGRFVLTDCNQAALQQPDLVAKEFIGKDAHLILPDMPHLLEDLQHCHQSKEVHRVEYPYRRRQKDTILQIVFTLAPVPPNLVMMLAQNVTEQRRAESALRDSEARFRTVADFTYDWEYWRGPDGRFLYVSPSSKRISGYPPEAYMADPDLIDKIVHPDDRDLFRQHRNRHKQPGRGYRLDFRILHRDGNVRWISQVSQAVHNGNNSLGIRASNRDITEVIDSPPEVSPIGSTCEQAALSQPGS